MARAFRIIITVFLWGALAHAGGVALVTAQDGGEEGFPLSANTAFCEPGYLGPFVDCTPWEGVTVTFTSADGTFNQSCTTVATWERSAGCTIDVPFGSTITASIDPAVVPAGYVLEQSPTQTFDIPDGPPQGEFGGPVFVLFAAETPTEEPTVPPAEETVLLRAWACPTGTPADPFTECEPIVGSTYQIEANGVETAESPVTTVQETGIGPGVVFTVPADADLTVTQLSGAPDGYVPAPGFDPFSGNVDDLPDVGFGGESTGPGLNFINVLADTGDETPVVPTGTPEEPQATSEIVTLPGTGTGAARPPGSLRRTTSC